MTATTDRLDAHAEVNGIRQERHLRTAIPGPVSQTLQMRKLAAVANGIGTTLPIFIERAGGGIVVDVDGNSLIDLGSGIAVTTVGNANSDVVEAVQKQAAAFTHTCFTVTPYLGYVEVCEELNRLTPGTHAKRSALFNSGAEAVENAVKIARSFTRRNAVVVLEHAYHGRTNLTMGLTAKNMPYKESFGPFAPEIYRVPMSYPFRDGGLTGPEIAAAATTRIEKEIGAENVAALIVEPIQGEGGFIVPAPGYIAAMAAFAKQHGIVFVADEIQSGFCRTGQWFAIEHEDVVPDLVTTAKGIAGGMPLSAVTGRADIMDAAHAGGLGGTYAGSPVSCAAGLAAIRWMADNDANGRAKAIEEIMYRRLSAMQQRFAVIGDLRGRGAMIAIELVKPGTLEPDADRTGALAKHCYANGVLVLTAGTYGNVLRFLPPLTMPAHLLEESLSIIEQGLER